jgi:hypothetical protein
MSEQVCPSCGAAWSEGRTCQDDFYQMLYWENEDPELGVVHHLMVLCYYLQHPELYSPRGLEEGLGLLKTFLSGKSAQEVRAANRARVDSGAREWKVTARPGSTGAYAHPVAWRTRAADVVAGGKDGYVEGVRAWAQSIYEDLRASGNLT